jgi:hypothetical protein
MVLTAITKIIQSTNSSTQYVTIPADVVKDSQYPFSVNEEVEIQVIPDAKKILLVGIGGKGYAKSGEERKKSLRARRKRETKHE